MNESMIFGRFGT